MKNFYLIIILSLFLSTTNAFSSNKHTLFSLEGRSYIQSLKYNQLINPNKLQREDILIIGDYQFIYKAYLGEGTTSRILKVEVLTPTNLRGEFALRLPLKTGKYEGQTPFRNFMTSIIMGEKSLENEGLNIPKIHLSEPETFALSSVIDFDLKLPYFIQNSNKLPSHISLQALETAFIELAESLYLYEEIGDFQIMQLVYNSISNKITLMDWSKGHKLVTNLDSSINALDNYLFEGSLGFKYDNDSELILVNDRPITRSKSTWEIQLLTKARNAIKEKRKMKKLEFISKIKTIISETSGLEARELKAYEEGVISRINLSKQEQSIFMGLLNSEKRKSNSHVRVKPTGRQSNILGPGQYQNTDSQRVNMNTSREEALKRLNSIGKNNIATKTSHKSCQDTLSVIAKAQSKLRSLLNIK